MSTKPSAKPSSAWRESAGKMQSPDDMIWSVSQFCMERVLGEVRHPRTEQEQEDLSALMSTMMEQMQFLTYVPHAKQRWFHEAPCRTRLFLGSNQSGKTTGMLMEILSWALGFRWNGSSVVHPITGKVVKPPIRAMIGAEDFMNAHAETIVPKMKELIPWEVLVARTEKVQGRAIHKIEFHNGSTIKLMSYDSDPFKWEGQTYHIAAFDEPPPKHAFIGTKRGLVRWQGPMLFSMTPLKEPWIFDEIHEASWSVHVEKDTDLSLVQPHSYFVTTVGLEDNPYLTESAKEDFLRGLDEEEREARQHGRFRHLMGRVYKNFDPTVHVLEREKWEDILQKHPHGEWRNWPVGMVVDPHDRKPFAMAWFVVTPRNEIVWIREWPDFDFYGTKQWGWGVQEYADFIRFAEQEMGFANIEWRVMDPNFGRTPSAVSGNTLQEDFWEVGLDFDCDIDNDLPSGHLQVREALRDCRMFWLEDLQNFRKGMSHYTWDDYKGGMGENKGPKEAPRQKYKDFPDLARYALKAGVGWVDPGTSTWRPDMSQWRKFGMG